MEFFGEIAKLNGEGVFIQTSPANSPTVFRDNAHHQVALGKSRRGFEQGFPQIIDAAAGADIGEVGSLTSAATVQPVARCAVASFVIKFLSVFRVAWQRLRLELTQGFDEGDNLPDLQIV